MQKLCCCGVSSKFAIFENAKSQKPAQKKHLPRFTMHEPLAAGNADCMRSMDRLRELEKAFSCPNTEYECSDYRMPLKPLVELQKFSTISRWLCQPA